VVALVAVLGTAIVVAYATGRHSIPLAAPIRSASAGDDCPRCTQLSAEFAQLQQQLAAIQSQLASGIRQPPAVEHAAAGAKPDAVGPEELQEARAAEAERRREYMTGVEQSFRSEAVDTSWAGYAASKVNATLANDEALRNLPHELECRRETCRLQIEDDGSGKLSGRMPFLAMGVGQILPTISAERIDRGDGRMATVLYLSSRPHASGSAPVAK
jgi:hypothetical protein